MARTPSGRGSPLGFSGGGEGGDRSDAPRHRQYLERQVVRRHREYRIDWGPGYRIYLAQDGARLIVLFGGGTKRRQQADVAWAKELHAEYCARKTATRRGTTTPTTKR